MRITTFAAAVALTFATTLTAAQSVTFDFDKTTDFSSLRTYAWVPGTNLPDALNHRRIVAAVDAQLAAKGLVKAAAALAPDVLVAYHASFDRDLQVTGFSSGWGGYRFPGSRSGIARTEEILTGTLIVDLVKASTRTIIWRGMATKDVDVDASPEKRDRNINRAAEKIFKHYPPAR